MTLRLTPLLLALGCGAMNTARPLGHGEHAVGLTLGGAVLKLGGTPIPLPMAVLEGRHGLPELAQRPLDVHYGLNLTGLAYGVVALHGGGSFMLIEPQGARPALTVSDRLYFANNWLDPRKDDRGVWALNQVELTTSWELRGQLVYGGLAQSLDLRDPRLILSPLVGTQLDFGRPGGFGLQVEARCFSPLVAPEGDAIKWVHCGRGALGANLGLSWRFGRPAAEVL